MSIVSDLQGDLDNALRDVEDLQAQCAVLTLVYQRARDHLEGANQAAGPHEIPAAAFEQKYPRIETLAQAGEALLQRLEKAEKAARVWKERADELERALKEGGTSGPK